jgi:hypothetical protein
MIEAGLIRQRTGEGMVIARARGKLRGKPPKLSPAQTREVHRMHRGTFSWPRTEIAAQGTCLCPHRHVLAGILNRAKALPPLGMADRAVLSPAREPRTWP